MTKKGFLTGRIGFTPPRGRAPKQPIPGPDASVQRDRSLEQLAVRALTRPRDPSGKIKIDTTK